MLSREEIFRRIKSGEIQICYAFDLNQKPLPERLLEDSCVNPDDLDSIASQIFNSHYFGDRFGITMGPIVLSHHISKLKGRVNFRGLKYYFDLRETEGKINILPSESLTVSSVENISLGGDTAAFIIPRLSIATAGIVSVTTYIDPYWEGILQLYITNLSSQPYSLNIGERIAICRFYSIEGGPLPESVKSQFTQKSHHYGLNWHRILDTDYDSQPLRKKPVPKLDFTTRIQLFIRKLITNWEKVFGVALASVLVAGLIGYGKLQEKLGQLNILSNSLQSNEKQIEKLNKSLEIVGNTTVASGFLDAEFEVGKTEIYREVKVPRPLTGVRTVWLDIRPSDMRIMARHELSVDPENGNILLKIALQRDNKNIDKFQRFQIYWLIGSQ